MFWKDKPLFYKIFLIISFIFFGIGLFIFVQEAIYCSVKYCEGGMFGFIILGLPAIGIGILFLVSALFLLWARNINKRFIGNLIILPLLGLFTLFFIISTLGVLEIYPYAAWRLFGTNYKILIEYWAQILIEVFLIVLAILANKKPQNKSEN
jgi:hypothetical protein